MFPINDILATRCCSTNPGFSSSPGASSNPPVFFWLTFSEGSWHWSTIFHTWSHVNPLSNPRSQGRAICSYSHWKDAQKIRTRPRLTEVRIDSMSKSSLELESLAAGPPSQPPFPRFLTLFCPWAPCFPHTWVSHLSCIAFHIVFIGFMSTPFCKIQSSLRSVSITSLSLRQKQLWEIEFKEEWVLLVTLSEVLVL